MKTEGTDGDNDTEAIGGDNNVHHPKQKSTNDRGKQIKMTGWGGTGKSEVAK